MTTTTAQLPKTTFTQKQVFLIDDLNCLLTDFADDIEGYDRWVHTEQVIDLVMASHGWEWDEFYDKYFSSNSTEEKPETFSRTDFTEKQVELIDKLNCLLNDFTNDVEGFGEDHHKEQILNLVRASHGWGWEEFYNKFPLNNDEQK